MKWVLNLVKSLSPVKQENRRGAHEILFVLSRALPCCWTQPTLWARRSACVRFYLATQASLYAHCLRQRTCAGRAALWFGGNLSSRTWRDYTQDFGFGPSIKLLVAWWTSLFIQASPSEYSIRDDRWDDAAWGRQSLSCLERTACHLEWPEYAGKLPSSNWRLSLRRGRACPSSSGASCGNWKY